jgi:high-affinity iron transporter
MNLSDAFLTTSVVTLREGFEAALVVGIVLACLKKANRESLNPWVYGGIALGIAASVSLGIILGGLVQGVSSSPLQKQLLEAAFGLVAISMLSWMLIWMTQQAKLLKTELEGAVKNALGNNQAGWGIFWVIFIAVLREGSETVVFILAQLEQSWQSASLGAIAGLSLASLLGWLLFAGGVKIPVRLFFQGMGILLLLIIGGLVVGVLRHLDLAAHLLGWCTGEGSCVLGAQVWDGSQILPDTKFPGIILKALFGYRQTLYLAQIVAEGLFLTVMGTLYFQSLQASNPPKNAKSTA